MKQPDFGQPRGFALVATLSILVLLALVAIGLLSLSTITIRTTSQEAALAEARANARLGLIMALGQLQKHAGDDRRVSVAADQISLGSEGRETAASAGRRFWTGIYDAWEDDLDLRPEPTLRGWLVSNPDPSQVDEELPTNSGSTGRSVRLVGEGSAGDQPEDWVEVPLLGVQRKNSLAGRVAWWTGDEGLKAMIATPAVDEARNFAQVRGRLQAPPSFGVQASSAKGGRPFQNIDRTDFRLEALTDFPQASFLASDPRSPKQLFHDLATRTGGLLVNVRSGGFREDLSMEFGQPGKDVRKDPLYTVYGENGISFEELYAYYKLHEDLEPVSGQYTTGGSIPAGTMGFQLGDNPAQCIADENFHFKMPAVVSLQVIFSLEARRVNNNPNSRYRLYLAFDPVVTFWNPLEGPVVIPTTAWMSFNFFQFPYTIEISAAGNSWECPLISSLSGATVNSNSDTNFLGLRMGEIEQIVLKPGEVIKLSQSGDLKVEGNSPNRALQAKAGFNYGGGVTRPMRDKNGAVIDLNSGAVVNYTMRPNGLTVGKSSQSGESMTGGRQHTRHFGLHYHQFFVGSERPNAGGIGYGGMSIDFDFGNTRAKPGQVRQAGTPGTKQPNERIYANRPKFSKVFPTFGASDTRPLSVSQLSSAKAPILMYTYSAKTERTSPRGNRTMLRFNPRAHKLDFYALDDKELDLKPFDFLVEPLTSWVNRKLETSEEGNAYYGGSFDAADGTSFVSIYSIPEEPIHSLGAFQHSTANGFLLQAPQQGYTSLNARQPMLPQVSHAIGNSFAPAVMAPEDTRTTYSGDRPVADHSYLANEALWDDWFFSSVAPEATRQFNPKRTQRQVAEQFFDGTAPLSIVHYKPNLGERSVSEALAEMFSGENPKPQAVELMASLIRVEGMFNVNSTSVEAWKALLSSLLGEEIVTRDENGKLSRQKVTEGTPVVGLMAPLDAEAKGQGGVDVREPKQWTGRRVLSDQEVTSLAEGIVREVRKRGPFLSLADFVNRRVGTDPELARAGALQSALDSEDVIVNESYNIGERAVDPGVANRLAFPEAEEGAAAAGIPGIVKQADLLTPLAPILSARSDTFLIRAYGEALDRNGKTTARAWCEAQVERSAEYLDNSADPRDDLPDELDSAVNRTFGRRFKVISFRWLGPDEV